MNTSNEDQASQSTNDQQSETSSANQQSPRSSSLLPNAAILHGDQRTPQHNHHHQHSSIQHQYQQQHQYRAQEASIYTSNSVRDFHLNNDSLHSPSQHRNTIPLPAQCRRSYTGVDKLIMAAMMEESAAAVAAASGASGYIPSGRGIGYFGSAPESFVQIPTPSNKSELELYRLLERANLLNYFGTFLNFGGDDVHQLCDADEDEFLEIMNLVGMTQKPLHVRRLQKALIEWRENKDLEHTYRLPQLNFNIPINSVQTKQSLNRALFIESQTPTSSSSTLSQAKVVAAPENEVQGSPCVVPHEVLVGAPKRLRLMDDLHKRRSNSDREASSQQKEQDSRTEVRHQFQR